MCWADLVLVLTGFVMVLNVLGWFCGGFDRSKKNDDPRS